MNITLVIMAAGIGSRFGGGIKQLEPVGRNGEIIMDYSIHDAIAAGFQKIVFVIRRDIERDFRECIGNRIEQVCGRLDVEVGYLLTTTSPAKITKHSQHSEIPTCLKFLLNSTSFV